MKSIKQYLKHIDKYFLKSSILNIYFIISALINGVLLRFYTVGNILDFKPLLADLGVLIFISSFAYLMKPNKRIIYFMIWSVITTVLCVLNSIYYTFYTSFASVSMLATSTQVVDVGDAVVKNVLQLKDFTYLWQPIFIYYIHIVLLKKNYYIKYYKEEDKKINSRIVAIFACLILLINGLTFTPVEWSRFGKLWNREFVVYKYGLYTYHINDLIQSIGPKINNLFGHDKAFKQVNDYFANKDYKHEDNEFTNIFEGKNVIMIHCESIQNIAINKTFNGKEVTPYLNKLASEGIYFSNFYAQVGVGTSSDSEFTLATSLMPSSSGSVFISYFDNEYVSMQELLSEKGYNTFSMHGNTGDFWNRIVMHNNLGFNKYYHKSYYEMDEKIGLGLSDKSFFKQSVPYIKEESEKQSPFYATLIMLSNHTPFDDLKLMDNFPVDYKIETKNGIVSRSYLEGTIIGNYFKSVHYADQAIEQLIADLDNEGLLDNTVVILYGDHDARMNKKDFNLMYNYDPYEDRLLESDEDGYIDVDYYRYELDRKVPFIIWTKDTKFNLEVEEPMGMIDVSPTLGNMFNFDNKYALGNDIFNVKDNMVVFGNGNFLTSKLYYNTQKGEAYFIDPIISDDYIEKRAENANLLIEISNNIINYNLIKEIEEKMKTEE